MLYLVGTPIGNLKDITERAREALEAADVIACEDTRVTGLLLQSLGITGKRLISYHEHNKAASGDGIIKLLEEGLNVVQVSDAGMPAISDPGADLVKLAIEKGFEVSVIPGPSAVTAALAISGLDTRYFHFEGFLPSEGGDRKKRIKELAGIRETIVLYEAPHRIRKLFYELAEAGFGSCRAAVCRELTKRYEEAIRMTVDEACEYYQKTEPKGEFCICLEPVPAKESGTSGMVEADKLIGMLCDKGMSTKDVASVVSELTGMNKKEAYNAAMKLKDGK